MYHFGMLNNRWVRSEDDKLPFKAKHVKDISLSNFNTLLLTTKGEVFA